MNLIDIIATSTPTQGGFDATIPDGWLQGRTAYGGLSAALALESAMRADVDLPALRTAQISYIGPLSGTVSLRSEKLRRGRNAAFISTDVTGEGGIGLRGMFVFMNALASQVDMNTSPVPNVPPPEECDGGERGRPNFFTNNFNWRNAWPKPDVPQGDVSRWVQLEQRAGLHPMVELMAIGDALPPAVSPLLTEWGPVSTMTWIVNLLTPTPETRDGWWLIRATASYAKNGCSSQAMHIWNSEGQPIATAMQSVALFV